MESLRTEGATARDAGARFGLDAEALDVLRIQRAFPDAIPLITWASEVGFNVHHFNQWWYEYTGLTQEQSLGEGWVDALHPDDRATLRSLRESPERPAMFEIEGRIRRADGQYRRHVAHLQIVDDGAGPAFIIGSAFDIEDHRETIAALRASEGRRRRAQDAGRVGTWEWDVRTNAVIWDGIEAIHGLEPGTFGGTFEAFASDIYPPDRDRVLAQIREVVESGDVLEIEYRVCRPGEPARWVAGHGRVERDASGAAVRLVGVCQDVTDHRTTEQTLRVRVEQQGSVARISQAALSCEGVQGVFDLTVKELVTHLHVEMAGVLELLPYEQRLLVRAGAGACEPRIGTTIDAARSHAGYALRADVPVIMADRRTESRFVVPQELVDDGAVSGMVTLVKAAGRSWGALSVHNVDLREFTLDDVYYLQSVANVLGQAIHTAEVKDALRAASAAKDEFLGLVSHELKTPITVIRGNAELVSREHARLGVADVRSALDDINAESVRLAGIIDNLLVLARLEIGQSPSVEPCSLLCMAEGAVNHALRRNEGRAIELTHDGSRPIVMSEQTYVDQVLTNLLSNALKYSEPSAQVEVLIETIDGGGTVRVLDRGVGFAEGDDDRLFEPFYRSPEVTATRISGVGIGLTVCKRLIEAQDGRVWARRRAGGGAEVGFWLPLSPEHD